MPQAAATATKQVPTGYGNSNRISTCYGAMATVIEHVPQVSGSSGDSNSRSSIGTATAELVKRIRGDIKLAEVVATSLQKRRQESDRSAS